MIFLFSLAFRNLFRNFRRTAITSVSVVFGVAQMILGWGLVDGLDDNFLRSSRTTVAGDVILRPDAYPNDGLDFPLSEAKVVPPELATKLDVAGPWTARTIFPVRLVHGQEDTRCNGIAYDAAKEDLVFPRSEWKMEGRWPAAGADEVVLGEQLARLLGVKAGDAVIVEARTFPGALNALTVQVAGVVHTDNVGLDGNGMWMEMGAAERFVQLEGRRTHVAVLAQHGSPETTAAALAGSGWAPRTLAAECEDLLATNRIRRKALMMVVGIIMAIAATGIANTVIMAAYERVREIGTLVALGMRKSEVATLFLMEGAVMGLVAGVLGATLGSAGVYYWQVHGINLGDMSRAGDMAISAMLYTHFSWPPVFIALAVGVSVALGASIWPARFAANLNPADAVKAD